MSYDLDLGYLVWVRKRMCYVFWNKGRICWIFFVFIGKKDLIN